MTTIIKRRTVAALVAAGITVGGLAFGGATAQADTVWRMKATAPAAGRFIDVGGSAPGTFPMLARSLGSGVHPPTQWWTFRRVGGTIQFPWYQLVNRGSGRCIYAEGPEAGVVPAEVRGCYRDVRFDWFQFRTLTNQPVNPGLAAGGTGEARVYRIHWMGQLSANRGKRCLVVPYSYFDPGTRLAVQQCSQAANQRWTLYPTTL